MKIRRGFVTNSSSASFVISLKDKFTRENFLKALGADSSFPMAPANTQLFGIIGANKTTIKDAAKAEGLAPTGENLGMTNKLLSEGGKSRAGKFDDSGATPAEAHFRHSSVKVRADEGCFNSEGSR